MAKGQLHSTGTICKAEKNCPLEADGGQHFDSVDRLLEHTAEETGASGAELRSVLATGVAPAEVVAMAKEGLLGKSIADSASKQPQRAATIEIDLSSATSDSLKEKFLKNLEETYPVASVKTDGMGSYTVTVDAVADPSDYSVLMAATSAAESAAYEMGYDQEEMEEFEETLTVTAEVAPEPPAAPAKPLKPSEVKELDQFDPAVHSVFSNAGARTIPDFAARALKKELAAGEWLDTLIDRERAYIEDESEATDEVKESEATIRSLTEKRNVSRARQGAMAKEMLWLADNDSKYADNLPRGVHSLLRGFKDTHSGVSIGTVKKAPAPKA